MPVPASIDDLSTTPGSNYPTGSESPTTTDDYLRFQASCLAILRDAVDDIETELPTAGELTGEIKMWPTSTAPTGYLLCDGSAVSRATYSALFTLVGSTFGAGDGTTTFNLPNFENRLPIGAGDLYSAGGTGGSKDAIVVAHTHTVSATTSSDGSHTHSINYKNSGAIGAADAFLRSSDTTGAGDQFMASGGAHTHTATGTAASTGVSGTGANLPPYLAIHFVIKT
jgi:microcystin-dependent protein